MAQTPTSSSDEQIEYPDEATVDCPLVGYRSRRIAKCFECPKFGGLVDRFPGSPAPFERRYILSCFGEPAQRPIRLLEVE